MVSELIDKYLWLIRLLVDAGHKGLTLSEISSSWEQRYGSEYPRRTFNNHREAIAEIFGIEIQCRRTDNCYFIAEGEDTLSSDKTRSWLVDTFTVNKLLELGKQRLSGRVSVENIPSGQYNLTPIMDAMLAERVLGIEYRKYTAINTETLHVEPWAVKEHNRRWYLIGWCRERQALRVYGLDRIHSIVQSDEKFRMDSDFDVDELFAESFGMYLADEQEVRTITLRTSELQARFLRDLPLHPSQKEISQDEDGSVLFAIRVAVNEALLMELMKYGDKLEVVSPKELRTQVRKMFESAVKKYK